MALVCRPESEQFLDREGARALDQAAIEQLGIPGIVLMENAARGASDVARQMIPDGGSVLILVGRGNNGGDGWAMARHLRNAGHLVEVASLGRAREGSDAAINEMIAHAMGVQTHSQVQLEQIRAASLLVDALYGTGLDRPIEGTAAEWIELANSQSETPILAIDLPSGLDSDTGAPLGPTIKAERTATFVARKRGMAQSSSKPYCGLIDVVGIGTPNSLLERFACQARI